MPQFTTLQKRVFPLYFKLQSGLIALVAVTHPPMSLVSLIDCWWDYVPITVAFGVSALNLVVYGPRTQEVMIERIHQGEINPDLFPLNRQQGDATMRTGITQSTTALMRLTIRTIANRL